MSKVVPVTIATLLRYGLGVLSESQTPLLDTEILLAFVLQKNRVFLHARPEFVLSQSDDHRIKELLARRAKGEPIAYIVGYQEFWSLTLRVTPDTLIPRPETEIMVEKILELLPSQSATVADVGTGSGAIALALACERPSWQLVATDMSQAALDVARQNAETLHLPNVTFYQGDWCDALPAYRFDAIMSNPPYIALGDAALEANVLHFEPHNALFADDNGLADLHCVIRGAKDKLKVGGIVCVEHGYQQRSAVHDLFILEGYDQIVSYLDRAGQDRITLGRRGMIAT